MSSIPSTTATINRNEQTQATMHRHESCTVSSEQILFDSSVTSTSTPNIPGQILTESDHEDELMELMDELIRKFLSRPNRRSPYRSLFRWTFDDNKSNLSYSVVVKIDEPSQLI
jgi:hypothetical protein